MSFVRKVREKIRSITDNEQKLWKRVLGHSAGYMRALKIDAADLEVLERDQGHGSLRPDVDEIASRGFLAVSMEGEQFALCVQNVCGMPYGDRWTHCVFAICMNNDELNESVGGGTTLITAIPDDWHERLVTKLRSSDNLTLVH